MCQNPALVEALARDRVAELRQRAETGVGSRPSERRARMIEAVRHATGWLLVDMGLRLALSRGTVNQSLGAGRR